MVGASVNEGADRAAGRHARVRRASPARSCGTSTPCRGRAKSATRRGSTTAGRTARAPTRGASRRRSTKRAASRICRLPGPASNYYGGDRPGNNLFGNSVVAVDIVTGKYKWHFQTVHHDIWDIDMSAAPGLVDIKQGGRTIPALATVGKGGYMFILDRTTGKPVFGVEERPVPKGNVPGEWYSPTQPFPVKPPALAKTSFKKEDMVTAADTNAEHAAELSGAVGQERRVRQRGPVHAVQSTTKTARRRSRRSHFPAAPAASTGAARRPIRAPATSTSTRTTRRSSAGWRRRSRA